MRSDTSVKTAAPPKNSVNFAENDLFFGFWEEKRHSSARIIHRFRDCILRQLGKIGVAGQQQHIVIIADLKMGQQPWGSAPAALLLDALKSSRLQNLLERAHRGRG